MDGVSQAPCGRQPLFLPPSLPLPSPLPMLFFERRREPLGRTHLFECFSSLIGLTSARVAYPFATSGLVKGTSTHTATPAVHFSLYSPTMPLMYHRQATLHSYRNRKGPTSPSLVLSPILPFAVAPPNLDRDPGYFLRIQRTSRSNSSHV